MLICLRCGVVNSYHVGGQEIERNSSGLQCCHAIPFVLIMSTHFADSLLLPVRSFQSETIFIICPHGQKELNNYDTYLNSIPHKIKFTVVIERNNERPFLEVIVRWKLNDKIIQKPTHTNRVSTLNQVIIRYKYKR